MDSRFKDQSNYLVAFLAAIIGLSFFKTQLADVNIKIFNLYPTLLTLCLFVVLTLLLGTYFGALAHLINSFNITRFPLQGFLSLISSICSAIALISPLLFLLAYAITLIPIPHIRSSEVSVLASILSAGLGLLVGATKERSVKRQIAQSASVVIYPNTSIDQSPISKNARPTQFVPSKKEEIIQQQVVVNSYKSLVKFIANYLYVRGYGVQGEDLIQLVTVLVDKAVLKVEDLQDAVQITELKNSYTHFNTPVAQKDLKQAQENLLELYKKVQKAYLDYLGVGAGSRKRAI